MNTEYQFTGFDFERAEKVDHEGCGDCPCDSCPLFETCAVEGTECMAFRNFAALCKVTPYMVGKHRR